MKAIRSLLFLTIGMIGISLSGYSQMSGTEYLYPNTDTPIFKVTVPQGWHVRYFRDPGVPEEDLGEIAILHGDSIEDNSMVAIARASEDPTAENSTEAIIWEGKDFVNKLYKDVQWESTVETIPGNGFDFIKLNGKGNFVFEDGTIKEDILALYYFIPDDIVEIILVFTSNKKDYEMYGEELDQIIRTISPVR